MGYYCRDAFVLTKWRRHFGTIYSIFHDTIFPLSWTILQNANNYRWIRVYIRLDSVLRHNNFYTCSAHIQINWCAWKRRIFDAAVHPDVNAVIIYTNYCYVRHHTRPRVIVGHNCYIIVLPSSTIITLRLWYYYTEISRFFSSAVRFRNHNRYSVVGSTRE